MARKFRIPIIFIIAGLIWLLGVRPAMANDIIYYIGKWFVVRFFAFITVIIVETIVFRLMLKLSTGRCFIISFILNLFSFNIGWLVGVISAYGISKMPFLVSTGFFIFVVLKWRPPGWFWITALAAILIGAPITFSEKLFGIAARLDRPMITVLQSTLFILLGFGTTLLTESLALIVFFKGVALSWSLSKTKIWRIVLVANIFSYIFLIPFFILYPPFRLHEYY
jgi:hypothetical protein